MSQPCTATALLLFLSCAGAWAPPQPPAALGCRHQRHLSHRTQGSALGAGAPRLSVPAQRRLSTGCVWAKSGDAVADDAAQLLDPFAYFRDLSIHPGGGEGAGEVQVSARRGGRVVATGAATVLGSCADLRLSADSALRLSADGAWDAACDAALLRFLTLCVQAEARDRCAAVASRFAPGSLQGWPGETRAALAALGYTETADGSMELADLSGGGGGGRAGEKGALEVLDAVDLAGRTLGQVRRDFVEQHNLLTRAVGVLVHNTAGKVYVHRRSATKSMNPSKLDMFVGGLPLAGESLEAAALNEVMEELGLAPAGASVEFMREVTWLGSRNRVLLSLYRVEVQRDEDVRFADGEVVWGAFHTLAELREAMEREAFVPGGLKAWSEAEKGGFVQRYLR